jgi:hypothetical protein
VAGVATPAIFALTNVAVPVAPPGTTTITATGGNPQSTQVNTNFPTPLQVTVRDSNGNPMSAALVTFTMPTSGPTAGFGAPNSATVPTNASGIATAPTLTANGQAGSFTATASLFGTSISTSFSLTNTAAAAPPPSGSASLTGIGASMVRAVNLTGEGQSDWIHWGDQSLSRKAAGGSQLGTYTVIGSGNASNRSNDLRLFQWSDGAPQPTGSNQNGISVPGQGNGFSFTAPADTSQRTLVAYVSGAFSGGTLTAHLSDGSAADFVDTTQFANGNWVREYTLTYRAASAGQTLKVTWVMSSGNGEITINGAALR